MSIRKRSVTINGHRTSYSLEQSFFDELASIASRLDMPLAALIAEIDRQRPRGTNLSSAIRLYVFDTLRSTNSRPDSTDPHATP